MQKEEIFIRYVHQLAQLQDEARNHAEAGLALRLHADLYDWDPLKTTAALVDPVFPAQSHFERKERIYFDMIKHFEMARHGVVLLRLTKSYRCSMRATSLTLPSLLVRSAQ